MAQVRHIGLLTGGGDCPGLNAVIRAVTKEAVHSGVQVTGILDGFLGLVEDRVRPLTAADVSGILTHGGTILGASNKGDPRRYIAPGTAGAGPACAVDTTRGCLDVLSRRGIEALIVAGGDGSMTIADHFVRAGVPLVGIPKTIDNDVVGTDLTFGFLTAAATATDALDRVHTTAASHHRVIAMEVMGRNAGFLALHSGVASGADVILIAEIPFTMDAIAAAVTARARQGKRFSIVCVAEGARPIGGAAVVARVDPTSPDPLRLGGIGKLVADQIETLTGIESRYVVLGHVQRGGTPVAADRVLATQFGHAAVELVRRGAFGRMVAMQGLRLTDVAIAQAAGAQRRVGPDDPLIAAARAIQISFGD